LFADFLIRRLDLDVSWHKTVKIVVKNFPYYRYR
jgi:hypothetical protein